MKIISPFTDFYEFDAYRYGEPDQRLVWVRKTEELNLRGNNSDKEIKLFKSKADYTEFVDLMNSQFLPESTTNYRGYGRKNINSQNQNILMIKEYVIGIYPYVYYCPMLVRDTFYGYGLEENCYITKAGKFSDNEVFPIVLTEDDYKSKKGYIEKIHEICPNIVNILGPSFLFKSDSYYPFYLGTKYRNQENPFKIECKRLFELLEVPVFQINRNNRNISNDFVIKKNPNILTTPLLKHFPDIQAERDVYNDIENFLWERKQEPISEPSNELKIQAAGFDKKTSFRNM